MDLTTLTMLALALVTTALLFGTILFGAMNRKQMRGLQEDLDASTTSLQGNARDLLQALEQNQHQQERILRRLENLETIVTSEAWEVLQDSDDVEQARLLLNDAEPEEPDAEDLARHLARRTR